MEFSWRGPQEQKSQFPFEEASRKYCFEFV